MKVLKKILLFILSFILFNLVGALFIIFSIKNIVQDKILNEAVKESVIPAITDTSELNTEQKSKMSEILNDDQVNEVINEFVEDVMNTMVDEDTTIDQSTIDKIFDYFVENKEKIESVTGQEINTEDIEKVRESEEYKSFGETLSKSIEETSDSLSNTEVKALKLYLFIISNEFKYILIGLCILDLLLIMLVQWSLYKWIGTLGGAILGSGITILVFYVIINYIVDEYLAQNNIIIDVDTSLLFLLGIGSIVFGLLFKTISKIIDNLVNSKKKQNVEVLS